jgi:hypothetical protein
MPWNSIYGWNRSTYGLCNGCSVARRISNGYPIGITVGISIS